MAKKTRKPIGRFGSLSLRGQQFTVAKLDAALAQARRGMAMAVDEILKSGGALKDHVFIVADVTHEGSRLIVRDLAGTSRAPDGGFVGVVSTPEAARVLRLYEAEAQALQIERPLDRGHLRVLYTAEGEVTVIDEDLTR